jgi:hypothetical protein
MAKWGEGHADTKASEAAGAGRRTAWFLKTTDSGGLIDAGFRHMRIAAAILLASGLLLRTSSPTAQSGFMSRVSGLPSR